MHVDLRAVEGPVPRAELVLQPLRVQCLSERLLRVVPHLIRADALLRARRELQAQLEVEQRVEVAAEVQAAQHLLLDLLLGAEDVRVVLREVRTRSKPVQHAGGLVAVHQARLGVAHRQVAVGVALGVVQLHVPGAVHRLHAHLAPLHLT